MGLNVIPRYRVVANNEDITAKIRDRLKYIRLIDETGITSDTVEIALADHLKADRVIIPPLGGEIEIFMGYDDEVLRMGLFVFDEVELSGEPGEMVLRARAAPYEKTKASRATLQSQKSRSWKAGTTIGEMVRQIAGEHGLEPAVSSTLAGVVLPHTDQSHESDMNLLQRLSKCYDAIAKPGGGKLIFSPRGEATTVSGERLPTVTFKPEDGTSYRLVVPGRDSAGTCIAYYRDMDKAERREVVVGEGDPVQRIRMQFRDRVTAESAAYAKLRERARAQRRLTYNFPGRPEVRAENLIIMKDFREEVNGQWLVRRVEHSIGPEGYRCSVEAELPNSAEAVSKVNSVGATDRVQLPTAV